MKTDRDVVLVFGVQGSGKSTLAKKLIKTLSPKYDRTIIFDLQDEFDYDVLATTARELRDIIIEGKERRIGVQITDFDEAERIFSVVFDAPDTLLVLDEAEVFIEKMTTARTSYFHKIISFGRHDNLGVIALARRPVELNVYLRAARTTVITFQVNEDLDIKRLMGYGFPETWLETHKGIDPPSHDYLLLGRNVIKSTGKETQQ